MENKLDTLVEEIELLSNVITKINFDMEGLKEDNEKLIENRPFMVRQIQANEKKLFKYAKEMTQKMEVKHELDAQLNMLRMEEQSKKDENLKQTKTK
jgi:hypothetical protein